MLGKILADRFEIIERIGEGGMGVVYRARQISVDRPVAIKVLNAQVANDPTWVQRFINEAKACSKLQHPNTIRLIDFGQSKEGLLYIAMEFLDGMNLRQAIERSGRMPPVRVTKILLQACQSLAEAHAFGIIHRDIKPDNLFLINIPGSPDFVKVLDFSVAKLRQQGSAAQTQAGVVFGTPQYMSPEQGRGLPLDARSDIYALGIVAYELLTGQAPFQSANPMEVLAMHVRTPPPPLQGVPDRVQQIVMRSLAKDPGQRYQSVETMAQDCQQALAELSMPMQAVAPAAPAISEAKTMFTPGGVTSPFAGGNTPPPAFAAGNTPPPAVATSEAKTMMAMPGSPAMAQMAALQQQIQALNAQRAQQPADAPAKTMMLESSEGIVSFAQAGRSPTPAPMQPMGGASVTPAPAFASGTPMGQPAAGDAAEEQEQGGSSALFWIVCILIGIGIGVLAYVIVAKVA